MTASDSDSCLMLDYVNATSSSSYYYDNKRSTKSVWSTYQDQVLLVLKQGPDVPERQLELLRDDCMTALQPDWLPSSGAACRGGSNAATKDTTAHHRYCR